MSRNTARTTHAYKKVQETRQKNKATNIVDEEILALKKAQKENAAKLKSLKTVKSEIGSSKKGRSSKAESSSSGKSQVSQKENMKEGSQIDEVKKGQ